MKRQTSSPLAARPYPWGNNQLHSKAGRPGKQSHLPHEEHGLPHLRCPRMGPLPTLHQWGSLWATANPGAPSPVPGPSYVSDTYQRGVAGRATAPPGRVQYCVCRNWGSKLTPHPLPSWPLLLSGHQTSDPVPVSPGTWSNRIRLTSSKECVPCPWGWFWVRGAQVPSGTCKAGHYCPQVSGARVFPGKVSGQCQEETPWASLYTALTEVRKNLLRGGLGLASCSTS